MSRQRDLLPLPYFKESNLVDKRSLSRLVQRRILRRAHHNSRVNDAICIVNQLGGHGLLEPASDSVLPSASLTAVDYIDNCVKDLGLPPQDVTREGALRELPATAGVYSDSRPVFCHMTRISSAGQILALVLARC